MTYDFFVVNNSDAMHQTSQA